MLAEIFTLVLEELVLRGQFEREKDIEILLLRQATADRRAETKPTVPTVALGEDRPSGPDGEADSRHDRRTRPVRVS